MFRTGFKFIFLVFSEEHVVETNQGLKGKVLKKKFVLPIVHWFYAFLQKKITHGSTWCHLQCDCYDLNVKFLIFSRNCTKSIVMKFWIKTPLKPKISKSLILHNFEVEISAICTQLVSKVLYKRSKKIEHHLIFINFGVKKFTIKKHPQEKKLSCLNFILS